MKIAENYKQAWNMQETYKGEPHGWVQWKGTHVCMDFHCECGHHSHIDAAFAYNIRCPKCSSVYMLNGHIEAIKLQSEEGANQIVTDDSYDGSLEDGEN